MGGALNNIWNNLRQLQAWFNNEVERTRNNLEEFALLSCIPEDFLFYHFRGKLV